MNLNKVFLIGNLTSDPDSRTTPSGQSVCSFGMATNRIWKDKAGQKQQQAEFHSVVAWGGLANTISTYVKKGSMIYVEGRLATRSWEDKTGVKKYKTEIIAENIQLGPRFSGETKGQSQFASNKDDSQEIPVIQEGEEEIDVSDIPL